MQIRRHVLFAALMGAAGFILRLMQRKTGFDAETGLALRGNLFALAVAGIIALAALLLALLLRGGLALKWEFARLFSMENKAPAKTLAIGGAMAMLAAGGLEVFEGVAVTRDILSLVAGAFLVVAGVCLFGTVKALSNREEGEGVYLLAAVCCAVVQFIASYRLYAVDPVLQSYYVELLAFACHVLSFYTLCGLFYHGCGCKRFAFFTLLSLTLTLTSLADGHAISEILMLLGMSAAELGFLLASDGGKRGKREQ